MTICVSYVIQGSCDTVAAMTLLHIGWVTELNFLVSLFNEPSTALYSTTLSVKTEKRKKALQSEIINN